MKPVFLQSEAASQMVKLPIFRGQASGVSDIFLLQRILYLHGEFS